MDKKTKNTSKKSGREVRKGENAERSDQMGFWSVASMAPANWPDPISLVAGGMIVFLAYEGFELIANTAGDVRDKEKTLPRAFYGSVLFVIVLYVMISATAVGNLSYDKFADHFGSDIADRELLRPVQHIHHGKRGVLVHIPGGQRGQFPFAPKNRRQQDCFRRRRPGLPVRLRSPHLAHRVRFPATFVDSGLHGPSVFRRGIRLPVLSD